MTWYADLGTECQLARGPDIRAVGWLSAHHEYPRGPVPPDFEDALRKHLSDPWQRVHAGGFHACELCRGEPYRESLNLLIPTDTVIYIAPAMIGHTIADHDYLPPDEFIDAVLKCPPQGSPAYLERMEKFLHHPLIGG